MSKKYDVGPDVDLERDDVRDSRGRRITEAYAERAAQYDPTRVRRGRRSLSGGRAHSPQVSFRVSQELEIEVRRVAAQKGKTVSEVAREALERYLAS